MLTGFFNNIKSVDCSASKSNKKSNTFFGIWNLGFWTLLFQRQKKLVLVQCDWRKFRYWSHLSYLLEILLLSSLAWGDGAAFPRGMARTQILDYPHTTAPLVSLGSSWNKPHTEITARIPGAEWETQKASGNLCGTQKRRNAAASHLRNWMELCNSGDGV